MSFACAIFATSLALFPGAISLLFFCGIHSDSKVEDAGASLMLASLVSQLLGGYMNYSFKLQEAWKFKPRDLKPGSPNRIEALLDLFSQLILQIPEEQIVFCIRRWHPVLRDTCTAT
jgi:hypothetical protein